MYKPKQRKCKQCNKEFLPYNPLQPVCSPVCALQYNLDKNVNKRIKEMKKGLQTHSDYLKALQVVFNTFIRKRDKDMGCISCGTILSGKYDAGHFLSVGAYPNLRFDENNVHGQCVYCNQHLHGNNFEYSLRLPERIGIVNYENLLLKRKEPLKLTIPEIKVLITKYKQLTK